MTPRALVVGGTGMLGHKLAQVLGARMETWATIRGDAVPPVLDPARVVRGVTAEDLDSVRRALDESAATVAINAVGLVKQAQAGRTPVPAIRVNALFPHELHDVCAAAGVRLVHVSTDCVFSGARGGYAEDDIPDAADVYGRSKLLGEVVGEGALTLRTSIVGRELHGAHGLFEWFLSNRGGGPVAGYTRAIFSGLTTAALSELIGDVVERHPDLSGLWHAGADPIDKHALLSQLRDALDLKLDVEPDDGLAIDRSLDSSRLRRRIGWSPPSWAEMLAALAADPTPYDQFREP